VDQMLILTGGRLAGTNTLTGSVTNSGGTVGPGVSPGKLTITGNYGQGSGGAMEIELGGTVPGPVSTNWPLGGSATLAGTLSASLYGGFYPATNATFNFLTNVLTCTGTFSTFYYPSNDVGMTIDYAANGATLRVTNTIALTVSWRLPGRTT